MGSHRRLHAPWCVLALCVGLLLSPPALAAESITITPPGDALEGNPFTLTVLAATDSSSTTDAAVYIRRDDGTACQTSASAVRAAKPKAAELFFGHRHLSAMVLQVPPQSFVGGLRVCAFVQLVAAPQTTLSAQQAVIQIRAPTGSVQLQSPISPLVGATFSVHVRGSSEATQGAVLVRAQRGRCAPLSPAEIDNLEASGGSPIAAGAYDMSLETAIDGSARVIPDRVCGWLYSDGGALLASTSQAIRPRFDGSLVVTKERLFTAKQHGHSHWFFYLESHTTGNVSIIDFRHLSGGRCIAYASRRRGHSFKLSCLLASRPRAPFVFQLTYSTALGANRSTGRLAVAAPRKGSSHAGR